MTREYKMRKRAEALERTRERILQATMQVHDEKGVAPATFSDIAKRAGLGQATISRHFATIGDLVQACGMHVWVEMQPPTPDAAPAVFAGIETTHERLEKLVAEVDAFYRRGALRLGLASRDRELVPQLHGFLCAVEAGVEALVREALAMAGEPERAVKVAITLMSFPVWQQFQKLGLPQDELAALQVRFLNCAIAAAAGIVSDKP
jgi:AcrR family transcriptional regulator